MEGWTEWLSEARSYFFWRYAIRVHSIAKVGKAEKSYHLYACNELALCPAQQSLMGTAANDGFQLFSRAKYIGKSNVLPNRHVIGRTVKKPYIKGHYRISTKNSEIQENTAAEPQKSVK
jgi:hypothetical protein